MLNERTTVIAEVGVNHNGSIDLALELVRRAAATGADIVKFQTFSAQSLVSRRAQKAAYQGRRTGSEESQWEMLQRLELPRSAFKEIMSACLEHDIGFMSSAFDVNSLDFLRSELGVECIKLGSGEITNGPLLLRVGSSGLPVILSTGMSSLAEVEEAIGAIAFGALETGDAPCRSAFRDALTRPEAWQILKQRVTLLQCTTEYPSDVRDANLLAMSTMKTAFGLTVGYSDHTEGSAVALAAVALGAAVIEKHFTLDRAMEGPDHAASMEADDFALLVSDIRKVEAALGDGIKRPSLGELSNRTAARKSLLATRALSKGHILVPDDVACLRPGGGRSPMDYWDVLGRPLPADTKEEDFIE